MDQFGRVAIIGVGLIGGSIGLRLRSAGLASRVVGVGRDPDRLARAVGLGAIDEAAGMAEAVAGADVIIACTPVDRIAADLVAAARSADASALLTDAGSTKAAIVAAVEADPAGRARFVGAHPIAGSERQGAEHGRADLFDGRTCVVTPTDRTPPDRVGRAVAFWSGLGCRVVSTDPTTHDDRLATTSHLPHAAAAALARLVGPDLLPMAAGAYRDATRVAAADASIWVPIFLENRRALLEALDAYGAALDTLRVALEADDAEAVRAWWEAGRINRARFDARLPAEGAASGPPTG